MLSLPQLRLVAILGLILSAQASVPIFVRQNSDSSSKQGAGVAAASSSTPSQESSVENTTPFTSPGSSSTPRVTSTPSTKSPTTPVTTPSTSPSTSNNPPTTSPSKSSDDDSSTPPPTTSPTPVTRKSSSSSTTPTSINTALITPSVVVVTQLRTESGSVVPFVTSSTDSAAFTSAINAATSSNAALAKENSKDTGGMSPQTRNTIIGVVVGIGGAAIFAGLFIVAWRIWGRKKSNPDESDALVGTGFGSGPGEKPAAGSPAANPFQSTLETYHNPTRGNVNASSNF